MAIESMGEVKRDSGLSQGKQKTLNIVLFGVVGIFVVLLVGAVIVMWSLLRQFAEGEGNMSSGAVSDPPQELLIIRDFPPELSSEYVFDDRLEISSIARSATFASVRVRIFLADDSYNADSVSFGVVVSEDGYIVTSSAVALQGGDCDIEVVLYDGTSYRGNLVGYDIKSDIGVIKIEAEKLRTAPFGATSLLEGERFLYIGLGERELIRISEGMMGESAGVFVDTPAGYMFHILTCTDRSVSHEYGGGIAVNSAGQIVGMRCSYAESGNDFAYTISVLDIKRVVDDIIEFGSVQSRKTLGYKGEAVSDMLAQERGFPRGVVVENIEKEGSLHNDGVEVGDIITSIEGVSISTVEELEMTVRQISSGKALIRVYRPSENESYELQISLTDDDGMLR